MGLATIDPTMSLALMTAGCFGRPPALPPSLRGASIREANKKRARLLHEVANPIDAEIAPIRNEMVGQSYTPLELGGVCEANTQVLKQRLLLSEKIDEITRRLLPDVPDLTDRINISLRLWAGYLDVAKAIAESTTAEQNSAFTRQRDIPTIESKAAIDPIYAAGAEAAPYYKHWVLGEEIYRDGIPDHSIVLHDWDNSPLRKLGTMKGSVTYMAPDFDAPLEDFQEYMQ